ncbi:MAG: hypothetical protein KDA99_00265, partial [Planctomycetales bacterium]|nr:hypothetical protein [Planctomycetales bacterium]
MVRKTICNTICNTVRHANRNVVHPMLICLSAISLIVVSQSISRGQSLADVPAGELKGQFDGYLENVRDSLKDEAKYGKAQQEGVEKDASTLMVLSQVLAGRDDGGDWKKHHPAVIAAAGELASKSGDYAGAQAALTQLEKAIQEVTESDADDVRADIAVLMKQVPIVNGRMRRGVTGRRFDRSLDEIAGTALTLAAIAEVTKNDDTYCSDDEGKAEWTKISEQMRDAAMGVHAATRAKNQ